MTCPLQVAELISVTLEKPTLSRNKTIEVVAETSQPLLKFSEMLADIPADDEEGEAAEVRYPSLNGWSLGY